MECMKHLKPVYNRLQFQRKEADILEQYCFVPRTVPAGNEGT